MPYYVPPPPPPGRKTLEGLDKFTRATTFAIYANIAAALVGLLVLGLVFGGVVFGALAASAGGGLIAGILQLVAFVYGVIGISAFRDGRTEFGPDHEKGINRGWSLLIVAILVYVGGTIMAAIIAFSAAFAAVPPGGGPPNPAAFNALFQQLTIGTAVIGAVGVYVTALCLQAFIETLMRREGREARSTFMLLSVASGVAAGALMVLSAFLFPVTFDPGGLGPQAATPVNFAPLAALLSIVALTVYKKQLGDAVAGVHAMIASRTLDPDATPATPPAATPAYPG